MWCATGLRWKRASRDRDRRSTRSEPWERLHASCDVGSMMRRREVPSVGALRVGDASSDGAAAYRHATRERDVAIAAALGALIARDDACDDAPALSVAHRH